jgi:hypothetical protein
MTQHNLDDKHHQFWNPKDQVEQIAKLPEFKKLHEAFQDEPAPIFGDQSALKKNRRIYRFLELAYPFLQSDQDAEAYIEEQQTSSKLRKFLDSVDRECDPEQNTANTAPHSTVKEAALKKTIQNLENRICQIRRQLGE